MEILKELRAAVEGVHLRDEGATRLALTNLLKEEPSAEGYIAIILKEAEKAGMSLADESAIGGGPCDDPGNDPEIVKKISQMFWQASFSTALDERCEPIKYLFRPRHCRGPFLSGRSYYSIVILG